MKWLPRFFGGKHGDSDFVLKQLREKFSHFLNILEKNNQVLKTISDMEEKSRGEYLFDLNYIRISLEAIQAGVHSMIEEMVLLGGPRYAALREPFYEIESEIDHILPTCRPIQEDQYTLFFDALNRKRACSVGGKNAQLGEMKVELGLPVPDGFAISVAAYQRFVSANNLQSRISEHLQALNIRSYQDLVKVSGDIQQIVNSCPVPDDLAEAITSSYHKLKESRPDGRFSLRSSAIGEDALYSFAGQYRTFLNVRGDQLVEKYREVLAGKFTPQAIYYIISHSLSEADMAMAVGCVAMVDARASGVIYTRDPVWPDEDCVLVNAIYGLGRYLVDGTLTPDVFCVSRDGKRVEKLQIAAKPVRLVLNPDGGTVEEAVPREEQRLPSISAENLNRLAEYALKIEEHYGSPQDIEWALDHDGNIYLLQTRPLRVLGSRPNGKLPDATGWEVLRAKGTTVCPGAGAGTVRHVASAEDLTDIPEDSVLVTHSSFPGLVTAMARARAIVVEVGGAASHMATLAREYRVPTISGIEDATRLPEAAPVTVDATAGTVYAGLHDELVSARSFDEDLFSDMPLFHLFDDILKRIAPLNLLRPGEADRPPSECRTYHDITRYIHQKAMEEMFHYAKDIESTSEISSQLESEFPLKINVVCIDPDRPCGKTIKEEEIRSQPMSAFWSGFKKEGWPRPVAPNGMGGFMGVLVTTAANTNRQAFSDKSFAIVSQEYMLLSLRMGYHFTTIEAVCTLDDNMNYIRMQYKEGGAALDRRVRRINLISEILKRMGFEHSSRGDYLDSKIAYIDDQSVCDKLYLLGRLNMLTKQLDMALSNDEVARWYADDIMKKLGLLKPEEQNNAPSTEPD
ncbi:MAG: PEP/pyruvate-binding domain-containing protein [Candidatus Zixiibacteriota bacterium]|jgi:pyruvate,water dikinase